MAKTRSGFNKGGGSHGRNSVKNNPAIHLTIGGQDIYEAVLPYIGKYKYVGIRTQDEQFQLGEISHESVVWRNGVETQKSLGGISATSIKSEAIAAHSDIKQDRSELRRFKNSGYYYGKNVAIIVGNDAKRGRDTGEIVIRDPKVVKILRRGR